MTQASDPIIEKKVCRISGKEFSITQGDKNFYNKISPTFAGQKFTVPTPTLCPEERQRRRMSFRNERNLYRRTCDASGKQIISMYRPDNGYKIYDQKIRYSDSWNALDYGQEYDFSKTFTENFRNLSLQIPRGSMYNYFAENSDYCNCTNYQKNCYLTSASGSDENCMYSSYIMKCNGCIDCMMTFDSEFCYMTIDSEKSYKLIYASNCRSCSESFLLTNCNNCNNCFDCDGLENVSYCFQNQQLSKEEYHKKIDNIGLQNYISGRAQRKQHNTILFSEDCSGDHIRNSKHSRDCFDVTNIEDCNYCTWFSNSKSCYDIYSRGENSEMCYEGVAIGEGNYGVLYCANVDSNSQRVLYSMHCRSSKDCFGCCGLSEKQYCIFNKQYSKEEYELTVSKIISHMITTGERGEFFDPSLSPFGYNETVAQEHYPIGRDMLLACPPDGRITNTSLQQFGYHRSTYESPKAVSDKIIQGKDLPSTIEETSDDLLQYAIACEVTGKLFRIQPQELAFYRKHNIPLPRKHPDQRHLERLALRK